MGSMDLPGNKPKPRTATPLVWKVIYITLLSATAYYFHTSTREAAAVRYLRARDCDVGKALEMMEATARFRATYCLDDEALGGWRPPQALLEGATPGGPDGLQRWRTSPPSPGFFSLDGSPVYYNRIGQIDPETLLRSVTVYDLLVHKSW